MPSYGLSLWLPQIVHGFGVTPLLALVAPSLQATLGGVLLCAWPTVRRAKLRARMV